MQVTPRVLSKATDLSFAKFDHFRRARMKMMTQYVGRFYRGTNQASGEESGKASPLNMLYNAVTTLLPQLVYADPQAKVGSELIAYRQYADTLALAINTNVRKIRYAETLRKIILDAIFMAGFQKSGIAAGDEYLKWEGANIALGRPYLERIDPDDIILDPLARDWEEQAFIGNRYRTDADQLIESGLYDPDEITKLAERADADRAVASLSGDKSTEGREIIKYVDLVDLYLPRERLVVTIPYQKGAAADKFLRLVDYAGPDEGPYSMLGFTPVADNVLPLAPAGIWYDLHILGNRIARKLARQAERLKSVLAYQGDAQEDAKAIADSDDGETVRVEDVDKIKEVKYGGASNESYEWMQWVKQQFSEQAGSIDLLSGVNAGAPTATQSQMLQANTSVRLKDMQQTVYKFAGGGLKALGYYIHTDPLVDIPLAKRVQGTEQQAYMTPEARVGDFYDFNFSTKPYSLDPIDPATAGRRKMEFATQVIPAAAQAFQMMGPGFKVGVFLKKMADEFQIEDADEWIDDPAFQAWIVAKMQMDAGDPGRAAGSGPPPMMQPNQPAPMVRGPVGGVSPDAEQNAMQQEGAPQPASNGTAPHHWDTRSAKDIASAQQ